MATALGQMLVRDGRIPADRIDEAFQRQILYGGQIDTVLLEMGLIDEPTLLQYLSRRYEMPATGGAELEEVSAKLLRLFPRRLAERYQVAPLRIDRRQLHVACSRPVEQNVLDDIGFMLSLYLVPHITTELRLHEALARLYELPLEARFEHLLSQLGEELNPEEATEKVSSWVVDEPARTTPSKETQSPSEIEPDSNDGGWQVVAAGDLDIDVGEISFEAPAEALSDLLTGTGSLDDVAAGELEPDSPVVRLLDRLRSEEERETERLARRREKVTWGVEDAAAELTLARDRDDIVEVVLRFAFQNLERVAFFTLLGDAFIGWDAIGDGVEERVHSVSIPADTPSALALVRNSRVQSVAPLGGDDPLLAYLEVAPKAALLWPLFVRNRLLGVLYGDCLEEMIPADTISKLQLLAPTVSQVFENLILQRKREQVVTEAPTSEASEAEATAEPEAITADVLGSEGQAEVPEPAPSEAEHAAPNQPSPPDLPAADPTPDTAATLPPTAADVPAVDPGHTEPTGAAPAQAPTPARAISAGDLERARYAEAAALAILMQIGKAEVGPEPRALIQRAESFEENDAQRHQAVEQVAALGAAALPALARSYPGRLRANPFGRFEKRPTSAQLSAVCQALVRLGSAVASPIVVGALCSSDPLHRLTGLMLLSELDIPAGFDAACRCLLDPEPRIAAYAAKYCTDGGRRQLPKPVSRRIDDHLTSSDPTVVARAIHTTRACRDRVAIGKLIDIVDLAPKDLAEAALESLREITKQDFGMNARKWRAWYREHSRERRTEWMLAGLAHRSRQVRQSAQQELNDLSGEFLGYHFDSPRGKREGAIGRWREWWELSRQRDDLP